MGLLWSEYWIAAGVKTPKFHGNTDIYEEVRKHRQLCTKQCMLLGSSISCT